MYFRLRWNNDVSLDLHGESSHYIYEYVGDIVVHSECDFDKDCQLVGKFECRYVNVELARNEGIDFFELFDHSSELLEYYEYIFDLDEDWIKDDINTLFNDEIFGLNLLVISRLEILPHFRRNNLGLKVMDFAVNRFGVGASLVLIKPYPLQFESDCLHYNDWYKELKFEQLPSDQNCALGKLKNYYNKIGFVEIPGTPFMGRIP